MPEASIVVKAEDKYSEAVKKMATATKSFNKDMEALERTRSILVQNKLTLKTDMEKARREIREMEKELKRTGDSMLEAEMASKKVRLEDLQSNLKAVSSAAREAEKQMEETAGTSRRLENQGLGKTIMSSGLGKVLGDAVGQLGNSALSSAIGEPLARMVSGVLSGAITGIGAGAMAGSFMGLPGAAVGAAIGGVSGLVSGASQIIQAGDDAFKSYVQTSVEDQYSQRESDISSGSAIAAQREKDLISFSTLFGSEGTAKD